VPVIKAKIDYANTIMVGDYSLIEQYFFMSCIFEGTWFLGGFNPILAMARNGKLRRVSEVLQYIARDELLHANFGIATIKTICKEEHINLSLLAPKLNIIANHSINLEKEYADFIFSKGGYIGYNLNSHIENAVYLTTRNMAKLGLKFVNDSDYKSVKLPWIDEVLNTNKEKNFFETRVTEYQTGNNFEGGIEPAKSNMPFWNNPTKIK
jgi:ribonucleoside-diphosphate reductase beta chain